ncbi:hypothetical protein NUW54_g1864 [Trametes sanguinea]|uniref:Uncharacterized protein n=1 Tax=Trametes sanguinea TaxID=158606 RepID=A0ACC1Q832_9APHY|nr:hypothetical protein NUW54_g1864 [Trametes sanguinea]
MSDETSKTTSQDAEDRSNAEPSNPLDIMNAMTSEAAGHSALGGHGESVTGESAHPSGPVVLNPGKSKRFDWMALIVTCGHVPILGLAYFAHVCYRRLSPRRLPPFTPLKLPGVYGSLALWQFVFNASYLHQVEVDTKQELFSVRIIRCINEKLAERPRQKWTIDIADPEIKSVLRSHLENTRVCATHVWLLILRGHTKEISWKDFETCSTHLANACSTTPETDSFDYSAYPMYALLASVPFAMLARRTRIPALFLPLNGLQRLLVGATIYFGPVQRYEHYSQLRNLQQSDRIAVIVDEWQGARAAMAKQLARDENLKQSGSATSSSA